MIKIGKVINRNDKNKLNENEYTLAVHCWIINSKKEILITQRNLSLNRGGMWEDTHGGVKSGETSIEVMNCKYVSIEEFKKIIKNGESTFTDFSQTIFSYIDLDNLKKENNYEC